MLRVHRETIVNTFTRTIVVAAAFAATTGTALAQTTATNTTPGTLSAATRAENMNVTRSAPQTTLAEYRNADALRGIYTRPPLIAQCADRPVVGSLPNAAPGSLEAQPGYNFLIDFDLAGACRKAF